VRDLSESGPPCPPVWSRAQGARLRKTLPAPLMFWLKDTDDDKAEASLIDAHNYYRKRVPFRKSEGKAA
jgi:hypothetical protein